MNGMGEIYPIILQSRPKWISINDKKAFEFIKSKDRNEWSNES